jgi:septal ring factor EnvC (AmiA/AmiB activator)
MDFNQIMEIASQYASQWGPAFAAVAGVLIATLSTTKRVKNTVGEVKTVATEIQEQKTIKELTTEIKALRSEQKKLIKQQSTIIDKITKIKGYEDIV